MKDHLENAVVRGFRAALAAVLALALALPVGGLTTLSAFADEPAQNAAEATPGDADGNAAGDADIKIAVLSDTHYYPLNYVSDCEDYETYVGGDPKMLEESGSILDAALQMVREDAPDILVVSGDLTKDGEKLGHEQLAERFQAIEDETDTEVFVINGNHDVFNYEDSCTFENGSKEYAETTTADDFRKIYANFGYNGDCEAEYFTNPNHDAGEIAGELSYTVDLGKFTIVAVDSGRYSPDADTGYSENEHITAGRVDDDLLPWVVEKIQAADAEGDTVIGLMHHGLVPHFEGEENILSEYVVDNWQATATAFADAGMRYIFTGHMHANDIAQFTSNAGNTITDLETGSLSSWRSPQRTVTLTKGAPLDDGTQRTHEEFSVSSRGVTSIDFKDHTGNVTHIDDFVSYTKDKLYPETLFNNMANGMLRPILEEIGQTGLRPWLAENLPDVDIDSLALGAVRDALAGGMEIELGTGVGRVHVEYRNGGIQLSPSGTAGLIGDATVTDAQILRLVDDVLGTIETKYIDDPDWLLGEVDKIVTQVSQMGVTSLNAEQHSIYDLVLVVLTGHYAGHENPPAWVDDALSYIESGEVVQTLITTLIDDLMPIIDTLLADNSIDTGIAFSGLWKTVIDSATDDGNLKETLDLFGFDSAAIRSMIEGLVNEYMSPSFLTGMGSLISGIAGSMLYDANFADDVIDGEGVTITFDGATTPPEPSVDNGLLPTQVTMMLGGNPQTDRNFRWYTGTNVTSGTVQVATDADFQNIVAEAQATSEQVTKPKTQLNLGLVTTYSTQQAERHSVSVTGLDDGASYYYRVGDKGNGWWSDAFPFSTGDADDAFTFINVNDSQGMVESDYDVYKNTLAAADATFSTAAFTVHGGDFVDDGANEDYWTWALDDANGVAQGMSMTPAAGNHEAKSDVEGITDANPIVSHFNLANVPAGQDLSSGVYYSYVYKNATFVVLNTNDLGADEGLSQAQYDWAYDTLANAGTQWKIVLMHKSPYSNGPHQSDSDVAAIRSQIDALAAACDVDLVLSGHDHVYNRTPFLSRGEAQDVAKETQTYEGQNYETALNPNGTAFVIAGTAGVKNYVQTPSADIPSEVALDLAVPVYSGITIDGDHLYYQAYKVEGGTSTLVDSFAISKSEEDAPAWKQVEDLIAALPEQSEVTVDDEAAIAEARAAYDALSAEDQAQVSNYDRLTAAEHMLSVLKGVAGKRTVTVSNADDFTAAVNDPSVGTILTTGSFEFDEGGLFDDGNREIYVDRDLVVGGSGELKFCRFHVRNGATLVLKDSVYVNDTRTQGSLYDALNPVEVEANSTLITTGNVSLRTEYGRGGSNEGVAVKLIGDGASAILGSSGTYWGSEAAVNSTVANSTVVINGGSYNLKNNNHSAVDSPGSVTVNGGDISSLWCGGTLRVNGGTFEHADSASNERKPVQFDGANAYVTGGTFIPYQGVAWQLSGGSTVHVMANGQGAVQMGDVDPFVGAIQTQNYKNVSAPYASVNGWESQDGIYAVDGAVSASSVEDVAALSATRLSDSFQTDNSTMNATVASGTSTVFGKYYVSGGGKSQLSGISGGTVIAYGPARTIQNNPVEGVTIDGDALRVVDLNQDGAGTLRLTGYTTPANAFDNGIAWSSDNEQTASVSAAAGQGVVTVNQAGGAKITATSDSNPSLSATVEVIAVKPALEGPDELDEDTTEAAFKAGAGFSNARLSFKYSVSDNTVASIDPDTGALEKLAAGSVTVTATLYVDGEPTDVTVEKNVVCKMKPEVSVEDVNALLDVKVADANKAMASEHGAQTFNELIANAEGQSDLYTICEVYSEDTPAEGLLEGAARFFGLAKADKIWKVDVTIQAAPYVAAFDKALNLEEGTHAVEGDASKTVTLVWSNGDPSANPAVLSGWTLEDPTATPVTFQGACTSFQVSFEYVGAPDTAAVPESIAVLKGDTFEPAEPEDIEHYGFEGWFTDQACTKAYDPQTPVSDNITLYGKWTAETYQVSFDADGGAFADGEGDPIEVAYNDVWPTLPEPTKAGFAFQGWFLGDGDEAVQVEAGDKVSITGDATLAAKWAEKQAIAITPDEGNVKYVYDGEGKPFAFGKSADVEDFAVEYRPAGSADDVAWTADVPVAAGTYDVRVARAEDEAYKAFEQTFEGGVVITKADQAAPALEVTPGVDEATIKIEGAEGAPVAAAYERSAAEDFSNAQTIEGDSFEATASGTYYVRAVADANHNAGEPANVTLAMVTFDAAGGTLSGNATWLLETGTSVGDANLPTATWNEHGFEGWALADGTAFDGSSVVNGDLEVAVQWSVGAETLAPAAPTGAYVAERLQGVSVALHGVNEINSANDGGAHPDVTFAASGDNVQPLIADSFQIGQPAETDGVWTVSVVLDAQKYLEAYAQMGDPAYGAHYFADPDEDGQESFTLAYDKTSRTWKLAEGQQAGYTFDITCLTLRPAELVKYTGGIDGGEVHFPDARVVDGQGNVYTIDQLNALLDEGTTARVAYFDGDGAELADDTVPGVYEARIVVDAATALLARVADQDAEDSVDVNVDGNVYRFSLEPSTLTIRNASDDAAAESGALDVELIAADAGSSDITAAVNAASGGVAAQLPEGTRIFVNDRESGELTGEELAGVRLFSDELLGADDSDGVDRLADLKARAAQEGYEIADEASDFQYLDLVDAGQSNLWVSSTEGATIYWKVPEGADPDSLRVLHFADLHREYGVNAADLQQQIAACAVEEMPLDTTHVADGYVSFPVERAGFSPFVLTWDAAEPDNPDQPVQMATVAFDANGGQLPAGAPASVEVTAGGTVAALPEPVRAGYTFAGWTDASGGPFTSETVVSGSMTVVAQWTANVYPVTLDPQGGAFGDPSQATIQATFGAAVGQLPQPSRDGYEFVGWFTQQQGGEQVTASTVYATAASSTYYAQWKTLPAAQAAVTLDANGGAFADGTATAQVMLADGAVLHRSDLPQPNRAGYLLAGWCLDAALTQPVLFADDELAPGKQPTVATEGLVLYAKWLGDLSGEASFSFANVQQAYTGAPVPAVPTFGSGFPAAEQARVKVLYHPAQAGADAWSDQAPRNVGSYDVRFVYGGSDAYAPFEKDYPAGIVIAKATLTQTGLVASPAEVKEGMKLADISLTGATVTSSETGAAVEGAWSWVDADGAVDESGMYQAVFVPTDTANYDLLYVEVPLTVQADEPDQPGSGDEPIDPDRPGSDDKPSNPDQPGSGDEPSNPDDPDNPNEPGSGDEPTDPDEPGTSPDQPGSGELGTGGDSDSGVGAGSDNSNGRNQVKLVATGDPIASVLVGLGAVLIAALVTGLAALRNSGRKN